MTTPDVRPITFAPDDIEALRGYVGEEVELRGGLSDLVLMRLLEIDRNDVAHEAAVDVLSLAPRLGSSAVI